MTVVLTTLVKLYKYGIKIRKVSDVAMNCKINTCTCICNYEVLNEGELTLYKSVNINIYAFKILMQLYFLKFLFIHIC